MTRTRPVLSIVIPTRNEAGNVPIVLDRLNRVLDGVEVEYCFVDDSDDETAQVLEQMAERDPERVRVLIRHGHERTGGLSTAVVAGLHMAKGSHVCVMDADLQHPPDLIPLMLARAEAGADLVVGSRYTRGGSVEGLDGWARRLVSRAATLVAQLVFEEARRSSDPLSGFFLCRRALIDGVEFRPVGFKILLELLVLLPPNIKVVDVPLAFQARAMGRSKATMRQGLLYLRHLRSLFMEVKGSARSWKFAIVGGSGLLIYLPLLALLSRGLRLSPILSFLPAFGVSVAWNAALNRIWTFADQRRRSGGPGPGSYLRRAVLSGMLMFAVYALLITLTNRVLVGGTVSAVLGMAANGILNWASVHRRPAVWAEIAVNSGVQSALAQLATEVSADRAYVLPAGSKGPASGVVPDEVLARVTARRLPVLWTEAPSHRLQRRTNITVSSALVVPVVSDQILLGVVICEREAATGFEESALHVAMGAVDGLVEALNRAASA